MWWLLHFSRLGEFRNGSGFLFNGTLILTGILVALFARRVHVDVGQLSTVRRGSARTTSTLITCIGGSVATVGMVPLNTLTFLHDRAATGIVLSFAVLLLTSTCLLHRAVRGLSLANLAALLFIVVSAVFFVSGTINLALFEALGFTAIFGWLGVFTRCLTTSVRDHQESAAAIADPMNENVANDNVTPEPASPARAPRMAHPLRTHTVLASSAPARARMRSRRLAVLRRAGWGPDMRAQVAVSVTPRVGPAVFLRIRR